MSNIDLDKEKMDTLKQLANVNIEISTGKALLQNLKADVEDFLKEREVLEKQVIDRVYVESKELIDEILKDFSKVHAYYNEVKSYTEFLKELQSNIHEQIINFTESSKEFISYVKKEENRLLELKKDLDSEKQIINQQFESIEQAKIEIKKDRNHLESQQQTLANSYQELKKLWKTKI